MQHGILYDQSIDNQIKTVQETEQVQTTTQNKKDENPFSAGVSVVFDETMKDDDKDEDTQENVALNARSVTDTAAVSIQETNCTGAIRILELHMWTTT